MQGEGARQQAMRQPASERGANRKRGARGQEATGPRWALRSGSRVERTRGGGIDATTSRRTETSAAAAKATATAMAMVMGNAVRCHHGYLAATALVLAAEAAAALIVDDADGGNRGVDIVGRASLAAGGRLIN